MRVVSISQEECRELLQRTTIGRLGCSLNDQPYVVPVSFAYEAEFAYVFSTLGKKIEWLRQNPKACLQVDELGTRSNWTSVIVTGSYQELPEQKYPAEREHAMELLAQQSEWWRTPLEERRGQIKDSSIDPIFFRIDISSISGLQAVP
jgi:nitroimidazol reductase NimA-like FMN-containing flavoprotein (pyridoxamine 5'-phosphate oxidase superfamily)